MLFRMPNRKRITLSLPAELVARADRTARASGKTRSAVMTDWLRAGARNLASVALDAEITAYYASMPAEEARDDEVLARASLAAARALDLDDGRPRARTKGRKSA